MFYKNVSSSVKTFHGVTFNPGETKKVDKYINNKFMILTEGQPAEVTPQQKPSDQPKKDAPKEGEKPAEIKPADKPVEEKPAKPESKDSKQKS